MTFVRSTFLWLTTFGMGFLATCALRVWGDYGLSWGRGLGEAGLGALASFCLLGMLAMLWSNHRMEWLTSPFRFLHRLNHEATHVLAALLTGGGISSLNVSPNGGSVQLSQRGGAPFLVAIAPYLVSLPLVAFLILEVSHPHPYFRIACGAAYTYHLVSTLTSLTPRMTDFQNESFFAVVVWILGGLILTTGFVFAIVNGGPPQCLRFGGLLAHQAGSFLQSGAKMASQLLS